MQFHGLQKMTLLDFPGKVACTLFTGGCNLRCPFCHNASLVLNPSDGEIFSEDSVLEFLKSRQGLLDGVAVTGGEPLLQADLPDFLIKVKKLGYAVKLDTNGTYPSILKRIVSEHLVDYVAVDIKNTPKKYPITVGLPKFNVEPIKETVAYLLTRPVDYEFRTTVVEEFHTAEDIKIIAEWIKGTPRYFLQNFEDSGDLIHGDLHAVPKDTLKKMQKIAADILGSASLRGI